MLEEELLALEEQLLSPEVRGSRAELERLLAEDFLEFGRSGRRFDRETIIDLLVDESPFECSLDDFRVQRLSDDVVLATYMSRAVRREGTKTALRSSIWIHRDHRWQLVFHQGTLKAE